ncbi:MAG: RNA methyltransferase [Spirochaetales bacterium]|nr:RNA methyltransferase [Spirochaetales bacterium]
MNRFSNIRIILENPRSGKNVGSVCRAMKNMGFSRLYIAGTTDVDFERAAVTAIHAIDILENAVFCGSVEQALEGTVYSAAISRRRGKKRKYFSILPEQLTVKVLSLSGEEKGELALVFGNEVSGLNDHDLSLCNAAVRIPTSEDFPSLNLSHAVQIITYQIYNEARKETKHLGYRPLDREKLDELTSGITENLRDIGFFKQVDDTDMRIFFRDILARASLSAGEANRLENIFDKIRGLASRD